MLKKAIDWLAHEPDRTFTLFGEDGYVGCAKVNEPLNRVGRVSERFTTAAGWVAAGVFVATSAASAAVLVPTAIGGAIVMKIAAVYTGRAVHDGVDAVNKFFNPPSPT